MAYNGATSRTKTEQNLSGVPQAAPWIPPAGHMSDEQPAVDADGDGVPKFSGRGADSDIVVEQSYP